MKEYIKISSQGSKHYYKDKQQTIRHREDGPAIEYINGDKVWYLNGKRHRMDGPAIEYISGAKEYISGVKSWWINGVFIFAVDNNGNIVNRMK
jgi:hypothetical protein